MRVQLSQFKQGAWVAALLIFIAPSFQNCSEYQPAENDPVAPVNTVAECTGVACAPKDEAILLGIGNSDPERLLRTDTAFDVGGFCDPGGFPKNKITYSLNGPTPIALVTVPDACDSMGRFRLLITLPTGYNFDATHTLVVTLIGIDENGGEVQNPLRLHRRELSIVTY